MRNGFYCPFLPVSALLKHWQKDLAEISQTQEKSTAAACKPLGIPVPRGAHPHSKIGGEASLSSSLNPCQPFPSRGKRMQS